MAVLSPETKDHLIELAVEIDKMDPVTVRVIDAIISLHNAVEEAKKQEENHEETN